MSSSLFRNSRLSWKLAVIYAAAFSLILILLNFSVLYGIRLFLASQATGEINNISDTIASKIIGTPSEQTPLNDPELVSYTETNSAVSVRIVSPDGREVNKSGNYPKSGPLMTDDVGKVRLLVIQNEKMMVKNSRIADGDKTLAYLQVLINMDRDNDFLNVLLIMMLAANIIGIALSLLAGFFTSKRLLSPIDKMTRTVMEIDIGDLTMHVDEGKANDELSRLAKTFNQMIDRLRLSFEKQSHFIFDASHELRTPIAVIRGYIDLINKWGRDNEHIFNESVKTITSETSEMEQLIGKLLLIAKSDNNRLDLDKTVFSLPDLLEEMAGESRIISQNHKISCSYSEPIHVVADRLMLKQALWALMENSIKYTPANGSIDLRYEIADGCVEITVRDTGIGIPADEIDHIFDRFYRVDKSRSKETGGSGLGLSIAQLIIMAHQGTVSAQSKLGEGTVIRIVFPLEKNPS